jgi:carbamate kinase
MEKKLAVVAIGGNSLIKDKNQVEIADQYRVAKETITHLADMIETGWNLLIVHGNGPQVGFALQRSEIAYRSEGIHQLPLHICDASTQGTIGYILQQNLQNELVGRKIDKAAVTLVTQVLVDKDDQAFQNPSKPIGVFMNEDLAKEQAKAMNWEVKEDAGRGWRRVVASPKPKEIIELDSVKALLKSGQIVITAGGGGIPVIKKENCLKGVEAVIDKDLAASLLAQELKADLLLISTAVEKVALNFGKENEQALDKLNLEEAQAYLAEGEHFAQGSMAPKIEAAISFLANGGKEVLITNPENIKRALSGQTGTWISKN